MMDMAKVFALTALTALLLAFFCLSPPTSKAAVVLPLGEKTVALISADGSRLPVGRVTFTADGDGVRISVALDSQEFHDEFLSMRPFRCLPHPKETWCHLAYPYESKGRITPNDLVDLEYALLFLFKPPSSYGIDAWNGLYFKLAVGQDGAISGPLHDADFNVLAVPPDNKLSRPLVHEALTISLPDAHRFARIEIR